MNNIAYYLSSHPDIKKAVVLMDVSSSPNLIYDICKLTKLETLLILVKDAKKKKETEKIYKVMKENKVRFPEKLEIVFWTAKLDIYQDKVDALIFDAIEECEPILKLKNLNAAYLIGVCEKHKVSAFKLWEEYRAVSRAIYIQSWEQGHRDEILEWYGKCEDIELSVVFPMFKVEAYLPQCIETTTAWKAEYIEFLFIDDGSPDGCADIVRKAAEKDKRIHLLSKENGGCASARQFGLERAQGRYVGFVDPDDYIEKDMFLKLLSRALMGSYEISYCGYKELYEESGKTREIPDVLGWPYDEGTTDLQKIYELIAYRRIGIWRGIYLKEMIERNHIHFYTDIRRFDDLPFKVETLAVAKSVVAIPEYLYYYRMSRPGQDVSADDERLYVHFPIFQYLDKFLGAIGDEIRLRYLQLVKLQTHRWAIEKIKPEYLKVYCLKARDDLLKNYSYSESIFIFSEMASRRDQAYFMAICSGKTNYIQMLLKYGKIKDRNKDEAVIKKLQKMDKAYY